MEASKTPAEIIAWNEEQQLECEAKAYVTTVQMLDEQYTAMAAMHRATVVLLEGYVLHAGETQSARQEMLNERELRDAAEDRAGRLYNLIETVAIPALAARDESYQQGILAAPELWDKANAMVSKALARLREAVKGAEDAS